MAGFQPEIAERICEEVSLGSNLEQICQKPGFPSKPTVFKWLKTEQNFFNDYARARELRSDRRAERIDDYCLKVLAGELDANAARVIIDAEKWQAAHEQPKVYGDRINQHVSGADGEPLKIEVTGVIPKEKK